MIEMHIHISLDKDTDAVAEGAKLKELLNTALVGDFSHVCSCGGNCQEEDPNQLKLSETLETFEPDGLATTQDDPTESEEPAAESEEATEEPKKKVKSAAAEKDNGPKVKIEDVRAVLAEYRAEGGDLKSVLKTYGAKLSDVKKEDYPALLKDAEEALSKLKEAK